MINRFFLFFQVCVSFSCFVEPVFSQSEELEKQVLTIEHNGKLVRAVPDEISIEYRNQRWMTQLKLDNRKGEIAALTDIRADILPRVQSRLEISKQQIEQIKKIRTEFAAEVAALDVPDYSRVDKLKLKYCDEIASVLLPAQIQAFANFMDHRVRILSRLIDDENIAGVDLTPEQKQQIQKASQEMQEPLDKILKRHQEELLEYRNKLKEVCDEVLTEDQKEKIRKNWIEHGRYIDYMSLDNILEDVNLVRSANSAK